MLWSRVKIFTFCFFPTDLIDFNRICRTMAGPIPPPTTPRPRRCICWRVRSWPGRIRCSWGMSSALLFISIDRLVDVYIMTTQKAHEREHTYTRTRFFPYYASSPPPQQQSPPNIKHTMCFVWRRPQRAELEEVEDCVAEDLPMYDLLFWNEYIYVYICIYVYV